MKKSLIVFFALAATVLGCKKSCLPEVQPHETSFVKVMESFGDPGKEWRAMPLWVWNADVREADIDRMLADYKAQGFGGAFVHPRPGLKTEYLSKEWFRLWKYALEKGKELDLNIWIYDENSYPSGFAGGHVPAEMPESYNEGQALELVRIADGKPAGCEDYFTVVEFEGQWFCYKKYFPEGTAWNAGYPYVDLLHKGVTEKFLELTLEPYRKALGRDFGRSVNVVFSDEPNIDNYNRVRWTPDLFEEFEKDWGYSLEASMPALTVDRGDFHKVRHDYNSTLTRLFIDRWSRPYNAYTEKHGLLWTGHYWEHAWPDMKWGPDNMAMYAYHQMPAIDMLFNQYNSEHPQAQFGNIRAVKELRSVANQMGRARTLSETYGGGGWEETFSDFKRLGDWEYVFGVNLMDQHLSHMTLNGWRKYDYPPVFTRVSPWWEDYKVQNDYFARLSLLMSGGDELNDVLLLEPTTTCWMYFGINNDLTDDFLVGMPFQTLVRDMAAAHIGFDLGSEIIIGDYGHVDDREFVVGHRSYSTVIIPEGARNLDHRTLELLKEFEAAGGELITLAAVDHVDGAALGEEALPLNCAGRAELLERLAGRSPLSVRLLGGEEFYSARRRYDEGDLYFFVNSSLTESARAEITVAGATKLFEIDAMSGTVKEYKAVLSSGSATAFLNLPVAGSILLFVPEDEAFGNDFPAAGPAVNGFAEIMVELKPAGLLKSELTRDNAVNLEFCSVEVDGAGSEVMGVFDACDELFERFGMEDPWKNAVQYRTEAFDRDTLGAASINVSYEFNVKGEGMELSAIVEQPWLWEVSVNGEVLSGWTPDTLLDSRNGVFAISQDLLREGVNTLVLHRDRMCVEAEIAPVILTGGFSAEAVARGWALRAGAPAPALGDWTLQGLPEYGWGVRYSHEYEVPSSGKYAVCVGKWLGTVLEVDVDGEKAGVIFKEPYVLEVDLAEGPHEIGLTVVSSLRNLYGPHYTSEEGWTGPWHFSYKYFHEDIMRVFPYGLFDDFRLIAE